MLNTLFLLKEKLSSTVYEWIIKDTACEFLQRIKSLKCYESIRKDLLNDLTRSFLEQDYLDPVKEESMRAMLKSGLQLDSLDALISQFESLTEVYNVSRLLVSSSTSRSCRCWWPSCSTLSPRISTCF